jgi:hypothetical protein
MQRAMQAIPTAARPLAAAMLAAAMLAAGCQNYPYDPAKATRPYPFQLGQGSLVDVQVIPNLETSTILLVNATATSYANFDLWLNQRYVRHIDHLKAGESIELPIESFWDERGEGPFPGGWFRYYQPTPIVLVQIQTAPDAPLVGLIAKPPDVNRR